MERGLASSNYVDYESDDAAFQGERDFVEDLPAANKFEDVEFPADSRSCYFDPFNPPKVGKKGRKKESIIIATIHIKLLIITFIIIIHVYYTILYACMYVCAFNLGLYTR
jgi:hypothetical protein